MSRKEEKGDTTSGRKLLPRIRRALFQDDSDDEDGGEAELGTASRHGSSRRKHWHRGASSTVQEAVVDACQVARGVAGSFVEEPVHERENSNSLYEKIGKKGQDAQHQQVFNPFERTASDEQEDKGVSEGISSPLRRHAVPEVTLISPDKKTPKKLAILAEDEPHYANLRLKSHPVPVNPDTVHQQQPSAEKELYADNRALKAQLRDLTLHGSSQIQTLAADKERLKQRVELLNELAYKLNVELGFYRQQLAEKGCLDDVKKRLAFICQELATPQRQAPGWLQDLPATLALLQSYEDKLKTQVSNPLSKSGKDWKAIEREAAAVLRTNVELNRRVEDLEEEARKVHQQHLAKILELSAKLEKAELAKQQLELEVGGLQAQYRVVREQYFNVRLENEHSLPLKEHDAAVQQCYKLFEEAKKKYERDLREKDKRLDTLSKECATLKHKLHSKEKEAASSSEHLDRAKKSLRERHERIALLEAKMLNLEEEKRVMRKKLEELIASCETNSGMKLQLEGLVGELRSQNASLLNDCKRYPKKVNKLKNEIKARVADKDKTIAELTRQLETLGRESKKENGELCGELEKLQALLRDKEGLIKVLARDSKAPSEDQRFAAVKRESLTDSFLLPARQASFGATFSPLKD